MGLARTDEISSTEKLLNLIRGHQGPTPAPAVLPLSMYGQFKRALLVSLPIKKPVTVSVDIGRSEIKLVKTVALSMDRHQIVDWRSVAMEAGLGKEGNRFARFFQEVLDQFVGHDRHAAIWTTISSVDVETRFLRIPKVPKKQIANAVYWSYKREAPINDAQDIFDYEVIGECTEEGVDKIEVLAYTVPKQQVEETKKRFAKAGYPLSGISIVPFAIQNLFRTGWVGTGKNVCTLFIGQDWSRIAIYADNNLVLSRDIKAGLQGMVEAIAETLPAGTQPSPGHDDSEDKNPEGADIMNQAQTLLWQLTRGAFREPTQDRPATDEDGTFHAILPALERVARQVERTIDHYRIHFSNETIGKVYISGELGAHPLVLAFFQEQVGIPVELIDPFPAAIPEALTLDVPPSINERGAFLPAVGMALSTNDLTPNFLFTNKDRERKSRIQRINRAIFLFSSLFMAICIGGYLWQLHWINQKKIQTAGLQKHLDVYVPRVDQKLIMQLAANNIGQLKSLEAYGQKYKGVAIIGEVCAKTPPSIRLTTLALDLGAASGSAGGKKAVMVLDGVVSGEQIQFESTLAGYLLRLKDSPMFKQAQIIKQAQETRGRQQVLRFTAQIELT